MQSRQIGIEQLLSGVDGVIEGDEHFVPQGVCPGEEVTAFAPNMAWTEIIVAVEILGTNPRGLKASLAALLRAVERLEISVESLSIEMTDVGLELALTRPVEAWEALVNAAESCGVRY